ncbi:hypothetical protein J7643_10540 [bacterium]|nr:hypothetical protein [bacterium]
MSRTRRGTWAVGGGLALVLVAGCGSPAPALRAVAAREAPLVSPTLADREVIAPIWYRNPRYPFHSERFAFKSGRFFPIDDGMGPSGDASFFYNGSDFYVAVNAGGGSPRTMAAARPNAAPEALDFGTGPLQAKVGDTFAFRTPDGTATLTVTGLASGSMHFAKSEGSGTGTVRFRYHLMPAAALQTETASIESGLARAAIAARPSSTPRSR